MRGPLSLVPLILTGAGVAAYFAGPIEWRPYAVGSFGVGIALSVVIALWQRDFRVLLGALVPVFAVGFQLLSNAGIVAITDGEIIFGDYCKVSQNQNLEEAMRFDKSCAELTLADIYWTAGIEYGNPYYYGGTDRPPSTFNGCRIGSTKDAINEPNATAYVPKPCSELTTADFEAAGIQPGQEIHRWQWD